MELPVLRHGLGQGGRHPLVVPEAPEQRVGLAEAEEVLGHRQLGHACRLGAGAVVGQLLEPQRRLVLRVGPEVEVVVEHGGRVPVRPGQPARRIRVTPSLMVVSTQTTRGSLTTLSLKARNARAPSCGSLLRGEDAAALQRVVDDDQAVPGQLRQHRLEVGVVGDLVGVDEDEVERPLQLFQGAQRRALDHADVALEPGGGDVAPRHLGVVRVDLERDDGAVLAEAGRHGDGRVAGEGADLEDAGRLGGEHQQLEETALLAPHHHPPGGEVLPGGGVHRRQVAGRRRRVRVRVLQDLGIDELGHGTDGRRRSGPATPRPARPAAAARPCRRCRRRRTGR